MDTARVIIGGPAGEGIAKTGELLGKIAVAHGYWAFNYRDYPSLIRGGHNYNNVTISIHPVSSHEESGIHILAALDKRSVDTHREKVSGIVVGKKGSGADIEFDTGDALKNGIKPFTHNTVLLGMIVKLLGLSLDTARSFVKELKNPEDNIRALEYGYNLVSHGFFLEKPEHRVPRYFLTGNEAIALGALAGGVDMYIAYPMTPSTPVLHFLAARQRKYDIAVLQLENEIAVVNAALGASYAGAITMVGTSGGGFALMNEALSLQGISEVPLVVYLAQRMGPATGVPTYTAQSELRYAIHAGHGEFPRVVVAPGDPVDAFERTIEAIYLSQKYRVLSIILGDKHLGESHYTVEGFAPRVKVKKEFVIPDENYKSYLLTEDGVSPRAVPGSGPGIVRATSYEHDENGITTEEPYWIERMVEKRLRKTKYLEEEIYRLKPVQTYGRGEKLIISWGSTKGAILDFIRRHEGYRFLQVVYLHPFPVYEVLKEMKRAEEVILVENNATAQLNSLLREYVGRGADRFVLKYDARPFTPKYLERRLLS